MAKRKRRAAKSNADKTPETDATAPASDADPIASSNLSLHDLFQQQMRGMLDNTDLDEEAKQGILIAASCPCCGAGGMSFTAKIKRRT
jgi:hypothetical protein